MKCTLAAALALSLAALPAAAQTTPSQTLEPKVPMAWNRLRTFEELVDALRILVATHPRLLSMRSIGKTSEGRDLWLVVVNNPDTGPDTAKAAIWIDGNIHGNEVQGGDACLYTLWYLTESYGRIPAVTRLVDERTFYVLPVVNADARAHWFEDPNTAHSSRSGRRPVDEDGDLLADEDGPNDLDGDGEITQMRLATPDGDYRLHPDDPRVLVPVEPGTKGDYAMLGSEGIDDDGDGRVNEDGPGGYDLNRNWPAGWQPDYVQYGAGDYPFSFPETRAIGDFLVAHPNVAAFQSYHNAGGMILRGPGAKEREGVYPGSDVAVYDAIGKKGEELLPYYRYMVIYKDLYTVHGGEVNWAAEGLGIVSFTNELWAGRQLEGDKMVRGPGGDDEDEKPAAGVPSRYRRLAERESELDLVDTLLLGEPYAEWKEVDHPTYGKVEVGGFKRMYGRVPPAWMTEEMLHRNAAFSLYHADEMPRPRLEPVQVVSLGGGLWQVDAAVANTRRIPTITARAADLRAGRRDVFEIAGDAVEVLAGGEVQGRFDRRFVPVEKDPRRLWRPRGLGSHETLRVRWLVRGTGPVVVAYDAEKGGRVEARAELRGE